MIKVKAAINVTVIILFVLLQIVLFSIFPAETFVGLILTIIIIFGLEIYEKLQKKEKE